MIQIDNLRSVQRGRIRWLFDAQIERIRLLDCVVVVDDDGNPQFCGPGKIKDAYTREFRALVTIDQQLRAELFNIVMGLIGGGA